MRPSQFIDLTSHFITFVVFLSPPTTAATAVQSWSQDIQRHSSLQHLHLSVSPLGMKIQNTPESLIPGIHKRMENDVDDDLRIGNIQILTATVPVWSAAQVLETFYSSIFENALGPWANIPLPTHLILNYGCLELTMTLTHTDGDIPRGIPWAFVRNWSWNMLCVTRLGFVGTYRMRYASVFGILNPSLGIEVCLSINWERLGCHIQ